MVNWMFKICLSSDVKGTTKHSEAIDLCQGTAARYVRFAFSRDLGAGNA